MKNTLILIIGIATSLVIASCSEEKQTTKINPDAPIIVQVATIQQQDSASRQTTISASGLTASESEARLSFKTGGVIAKILVREGENIRKGQLLATLNTTEIDAQVAQAEIALAKAQRDLARVTALYKDSVATLEQFQNAGTALDIANRTLEIARYNRAFSEIRATEQGVVLKKLMNEGEVVGPGTPVLYTSADGRAEWKLVVALADKQWAKLQIGNSARITLDAFPDTEFTGTISALGQGANPRSGLYNADIRLQNPPTNIAVGLFGQAHILASATGVQSTITLPIEAIIEGEGNSAFVFIVKDNKASKIPVRIISVAKGNALVEGALQQGANVVTAGSAYLSDGKEVQISK